MAKKRIGELPPRYSFILNPYKDVRFSKCPQCNRPTHPRKFALLIHVKDYGPLSLGKTCRYCSRCELIIAHQDEVEPLLQATMERIAPHLAEMDYLVIGTVDLRVWKRGTREPILLEQVLQNAAEFKRHLTVDYQPAMWVYTGEKGEK